jgi:hypothetical protein
MPDSRNRVVLRLAPEQSDLLHAVSFQTEVSMTALCRNAVSRYLAGLPDSARALSDWIASGRLRDRRKRPVSEGS